MSDQPHWDYWLHEDLPNGRYRQIDRHLGENDIRSEEYDLDLEKWCGRKHFFWTAQEAALISFFRDPDKVERTEEDFILHNGVMGPRGDDDEDGKRNIELREYITDLYDRIRDAQEKRELPQLLRRDLYIEWAELVKIDIPQSVLHALKAAERERAPPGPALSKAAEDATSDSDDELDDKVASQDSKFRNGARKVILALLLESGLINRTTTKLSQDLEDKLRDEAQKRADDEIVLGNQTIIKRLKEARDLLR
jgi:hypothetical protein